MYRVAGRHLYRLAERNLFSLAVKGLKAGRKMSRVAERHRG